MFKTGNKDYMCILKYDTDTNSPIVKDFFKSLKDSSYVHNRRKFEPNATEKVASITNITEVGVPEQIASIVEENKANATEIDVKDKRAIQTEANFNMIVNGYQCARMIRVKHFHQFLCSLAVSTNQTILTMLEKRHPHNRISHIRCLWKNVSYFILEYYWMCTQAQSRRLLRSRRNYINSKRFTNMCY